MRINQLRENNYIDQDEADEYSRGLIQPTQRNVSRFVNFLREKWSERSKQRYDSWGDTQDKPWSPPPTLEGACKFTSLFANRIFGGRMRGNEHHQYLKFPNGKIIDPVPVPDMKDPQYHDEEFWMNPDHKNSLESCLPRVNDWVKEFMSMTESRIMEVEGLYRLPDEASWHKGAFTFASLKDDNRRFMVNPDKLIIILGERDVLKGDGVPESHDSEFRASGAPGSRHDYMFSGWIGIGGGYKEGVIHFAPPVTDEDLEDPTIRQAAMTVIDLFKRSGASKNTVLRNFGKRGEQKLGAITEDTITELTKGVKKGSQKRSKVGFATDDPSKYVGKWEEYTEPQGINSNAGKKMTKTEGVNPDASVPFKWIRNSIAEFSVGGVGFRAHLGVNFGFTNTEKLPNKIPLQLTNKVFSTLINIVNDYINRNKPEIIQFSGGDKSRNKLYARLVKLFKHTLPKGYTIQENPIGNMGVIGYSIVKENVGITEGVVDGMKFYHGQPRPASGQIEKFKIPHEDDGIYFTNRPEFSSAFATEFRAEEQDPSVDPFAETGVVYPVYLDLKNPLILNGEDEATFQKYTQRGFNRKELMSNGYDGIIMKYDDGEIEAQAYDPKQIRSAISEELIRLYRGVNSGQEGNSYYTTDKEWARQFTQSGRDNEIKSVRYSTNRIFKNDPLPRAYNLDDYDIAIMDKAWDEGYKGVWMDEGDGQPDSVYFMRERPSDIIGETAMNMGEAFDYTPGLKMVPNEQAEDIIRSAGGEVIFAVVFTVEDAQYIAYAERDTDYPGLFAFSFNEVHASGTTPETYEPTGNQNPMRVFSGAAKSLQMFIKKYNPPAVQIIASLWKQSDVYKRMIHKIDIPGYNVERSSTTYPVEGLILVRTASSLAEGFSLGPGMTRGLSNSSTGLGSAPPQIDITQTPWQKKANGKRKMDGNKAPSVVVRRNVKKSTRNKVRKLDSPVTEVFGDPSNTFPYQQDGDWISIDTGVDDLEIVVGMEDIRNYNQQLPPGMNFGMATINDGNINMGVEPANIGMATKDTIKLFNTLIKIIKEYVEINNPDRIYLVAVKPMEGIYQKLIRKFVDTDIWNIKVIKDIPIPILGEKLNAYMIERKSVVTEMFRTPKHKEFNADYEVEDGDEIVAKGSVNAGVIDEFMIRDDIKNNDFRGKYMSGLMSAIVRDADMTNSNMSIQILDKEDLEMKRFLERFGFRHVGDGVFKRTAGAITPPSVIY